MKNKSTSLFLWLINNSVRLTKYVVEQSNSNVREYFKNSSINCYRYIVDERLKKWQRIMWWIFHLCTMVLAVWLVSYTGSGSLLTSIALSRNATDTDLKHVPHPVISVCSVDRISRARALSFINSLQSNESTKYSEKDIYNFIAYLDFVYELEYPMSSDFKTIEAILNPLNLDDLLKFLTPSCEEMFVRCIWRSKKVNCSEYFSFRKTMDGYCCIFNLYNSDADRNNSKENLMALPRIENGLSLLINSQFDDYTDAGTKIFISKPGDYPDISSGGCTQIYLELHTETFITLDAVHVTGTAEVERIPPLIRGCLFSSDRTHFKDSFSDCTMRCRKRSIRTMCHCVPFFLPMDVSDNVCQLADMICLKQWKDSWNVAWSAEKYLFVTDDVDGNVQTPPCQYCIPPCEDDKYLARHYAISVDPNDINSAPNTEKSKLLKGINFKNYSIVNIYFPNDTVPHLVYGVLSTWLNLLSSLGGVCGLVLGGSLISLVELLYFLIGGPSKSSSKKRKRKYQRSLYWTEFPN